MKNNLYELPFALGFLFSAIFSFMLLVNIIVDALPILSLLFISVVGTLSSNIGAVIVLLILVIIGLIGWAGIKD